jgi:hypothetical protein
MLNICMTTISNPLQTTAPQVSAVQMEQIEGLLNKIQVTVNKVDENTKKTVTQYVSDMVFKYFDTNHEHSGLFFIGWIILGICIWLPMKLFNLFLSVIKFLFLFFIFLLIFIPLILIGLAFAVLIMVLIKIWTLGKTFIEALIPAINAILPVPINIWNLIAGIFNGIGKIARKFGARFPRMPTANSNYRIKHHLPSIFAIIDLVTTPLQNAAWKGVEEALN